MVRRRKQTREQRYDEVLALAKVLNPGVKLPDTKPVVKSMSVKTWRKQNESQRPD